ncbi:MAG: sigma-70 family RNA polymerase sigma factor [Bacteroidales bacterium]|nr:sigma-70 family RNA polymerase sigma factor [Bacteroidales bacterium]
MKEEIGWKPTRELVLRAVHGDGMAFTALWDTHIDALRAFIKSEMGLLDDFYVDDVCSRSFEKAFRQIRTYDPEKSRFSTWLKVIAHRTALDTLEQERRKNRRQVSLDESVGASAFVADTVPDEIDTPLERMIRHEDQAETRCYVDALPDLYRTVARLRLLDGLQYKEIAEETGLELNTVRTRIRRAKSIIANMQENGEEI